MPIFVWASACLLWAILLMCVGMLLAEITHTLFKTLSLTVFIGRYNRRLAKVKFVSLIAYFFYALFEGITSRVDVSVQMEDGSWWKGIKDWKLLPLEKNNGDV